MIYPRKIQTAPAEEPISLSEAKLHCHIDHTEEDALITSLVTAAREYVEQVTGRALITQTWDLYLPCFPCGDIKLPFGGLQSVSMFEWTDSAGGTNAWTVSGGNLMDGSTLMAHIDTVSEPALIQLAYAMTWPTTTLKTSNPIHIRFTCGYGDAADVPGPFKQAMLLLVEHFYRNRNAVVTGNNASADSKPLALAVDSLLANYRLW